MKVCKQLNTYKMKKMLYFTMLALLLSACSQQSSPNESETEVSAEAKISTTDKELTDKKIDIPHSRYDTILENEKGEEYRVYLVAEEGTEKEETLGGDSYMGQEGDPFYSGTYSFKWVKTGTEKVKTQDIKINYSFNKDLSSIFVVNSNTLDQPDLLFLEKRVTTNDSVASVFYIQGGELVQADSVEYTLPPKHREKNLYQSMTYDPWDQAFTFFDLHFSNGKFKTTESITFKDEKWADGEMLAQKWKQDPDYFVTMGGNDIIDSDFMAYASEGRFKHLDISLTQTREQIESILGNPEDEFESDVDYYQVVYPDCDCQVWYKNGVPKTISLVGKNLKSYSIDDIKSTVGSPQSQFESPKDPDKYILSYSTEEYHMTFRFKNAQLYEASIQIH